MFGIFGRVTISKSRLCSRPLCANDAEVLLLFEYESRLVELRGLSGVRDSNLLELCANHADRFRPPHGWSCQDVRQGQVRAESDESRYAR
jgi:hypothetical protein